jgi:hypothetical protein
VKHILLEVKLGNGMVLHGTQLLTLLLLDQLEQRGRLERKVQLELVLLGLQDYREPQVLLEYLVSMVLQEARVQQD